MHEGQIFAGVPARLITHKAKLQASARIAIFELDF